MNERPQDQAKSSSSKKVLGIVGLLALIISIGDFSAADPKRILGSIHISADVR